MLLEGEEGRNLGAKRLDLERLKHTHTIGGSLWGETLINSRTSPPNIAPVGENRNSGETQSPPPSLEPRTGPAAGICSDKAAHPCVGLALESGLFLMQEGSRT